VRFGDKALAGWARVIGAVHGAGGRMAPQLWHVGPRLEPGGTSWVAPPPVDSASGLRDWTLPRVAPMTEAAIADTLDAYGRAAANAVRLGFDAIDFPDSAIDAVFDEFDEAYTFKMHFTKSINPIIMETDDEAEHDA
jgi:hypothetical protein